VIICSLPLGTQKGLIHRFAGRLLSQAVSVLKSSRWRHRSPPKRGYLNRKWVTIAEVLFQYVVFPAEPGSDRHEEEFFLVELFDSGR
jgi:hypothetical protein